jgi:hypothetical protein
MRRATSLAPTTKSVRRRQDLQQLRSYISSLVLSLTAILVPVAALYLLATSDVLLSIRLNSRFRRSYQAETLHITLLYPFSLYRPWRNGRDDRTRIRSSRRLLSWPSNLASTHKHVCSAASMSLLSFFIRLGAREGIVLARQCLLEKI